MRTATTRPRFRPTLYLAFELGNSEWVLAMTTGMAAGGRRCCADNARSSQRFVTAWRGRLALPSGLTGCCPWHRSLEGVRSSPLLHFAVGGFTKFGCSTHGRHG